jgi:hypothetical protein
MLDKIIDGWLYYRWQVAQQWDARQVAEQLDARLAAHARQVAEQWDARLAAQRLRDDTLVTIHPEHRAKSGA